MPLAELDLWHALKGQEGLRLTGHLLLDTCDRLRARAASLDLYVIKLIEIDWQWCLVDYSLHAGDSEAVVVGVVKACVHHPVLAEAEYLPVNKRANLAIPDGADEAFALQVDGLKHPSGLIVCETDPR
ncbi:hypothetical protein EYF80_009055 [Liparis tanakae]|uniref:Uncharacterized protein n=1 Tax=Liparis tanakae TaxID=230148 RepID=A0A4Z2IT63_9TELE|nr:hypothetical protein EYF80_009055 [Liparis tanakae]